MLQTAPLQVQQHLFPRLRGFTKPIGECHQFLLTVRRGAHHHQDALIGLFHPHPEVNPVDPQVHVPLVGQAAPLPLRMFVLPNRLQAADRARRQPRRIATQQRGQRFPETAGRDPLQVQPRQQLFDHLGPSQIGRQDRRGEAQRPGPIPHPRCLHRHRADAGLDRAFGQLAVAYQTRPTSGIQLVGMPGQELGHLRFNRLRQQRPSSLSQHFGQRVPNLVRHRWILQRENVIVTHGVFTPLQKG